MKIKLSVAICPPDEVVLFVKSLKDALAEKIGNYPSRNAQAHITINGFEIEETESHDYLPHVTAFCNKIAPFRIGFDAIGTFSNGAIYLSPDAASKARLVAMMKDFHPQFPKVPEVSIAPHMSIGRRLSKENMAAAKALFEEMPVGCSFELDSLALRKFNPARRQYEVDQRFPLQGTGGYGSEVGPQGGLL